MGWSHNAELGRPMGQKDTGVETTYGKRETATCQVERRPRHDCGESLDAGGIRPVTLEIGGGGYVQQGTVTG